MGVFKRLLDLEEAELDTDIFRRRADCFLFQRVAGRRVRVALAGRELEAGPSDRTGHFRAEVDLDEATVAAGAEADGSCRWLSYTALADDEDDGLLEEEDDDEGEEEEDEGEEEEDEEEEDEEDDEVDFHPGPSVLLLSIFAR